MLQSTNQCEGPGMTIKVHPRVTAETKPYNWLWLPWEGGGETANKQLHFCCSCSCNFCSVDYRTWKQFNSTHTHIKIYNPGCSTYWIKCIEWFDRRRSHPPTARNNWTGTTRGGWLFIATCKYITALSPSLFRTGTFPYPCHLFSN